MGRSRKKPAGWRTTHDRWALYEQAVQQPMVTLGLIEDLAEDWMDFEPTVLREDFSGSAQLSGLWVASDAKRQALAIDHDAAALDYAELHHRKPLGPADNRLKLKCNDVMKIHRPQADVIVSLNFSHFIFHDRAGLLRYLKHARKVLRPGGMIMLDSFGGSAGMQPSTDERPFASFTYLWEQGPIDPVTHRFVSHIHFRMAHGRMIRCAFTYDWRHWSVAALIDALHEAGFESARVLFESEDGYLEDFGDAVPEAWVAYVAAK